MKFSKEQLVHLADLAKLELGSQEIKAYQAQLKDILSYVAKINKLNLTDIPESLTGVLSTPVEPRPDQVRPSVSAAIEQARELQKKYVAVPAVFDNQKNVQD